MQRGFLLLQSLFSAARRALSLSRVVLPLIRVLAALQRFMRGYCKSFKSLGVSASTGLPESPTTPQKRFRSTQAPHCCMPSSLPSGLDREQQDTLLPQGPEYSIAPETTLRTLPIPFVPKWFQRHEHRRLVYVISLPHSTWIVSVEIHCVLFKARKSQTKKRSRLVR